MAAEPGVLSDEGDQRMVAVAADPGGTVAVAVGLDDGEPAAWGATETGSWARLALGRAVPADAVLNHIAHIDAGEGAFAVVGSVGGAAAAWITDARSWRRAEMDVGPPITHVADTGHGPVAFATGAGGGAVWKSFDGTFWVRSFDQPTTFERPGAAHVVGVVDAAAGLVALVEREGQGPEVWASPDGFAWQVGPATGADLLPAPGPPRASSLVDAGDGLVVVVGSTAEADGVDAAAWTSSAARTWEPAPHDEAVLGGDGSQEMVAVARVEGTIVAVGTEAAERGSGLDAAVWSSADGVRWQRADAERLRAPGRQQVTGVAVLDGTAIAVGWDDSGGEPDAAVWVIGADEDPAPPPVRSPTPAWVRVEGESALEAPGEQRLSAVAVLDDGFVAVGSVRAPVGVVADPGPSRRVGPVQVGDSDGAVWRSDDGRSWRRAADAVLGGDGDQRALAVAVGAGGVVAVGVDGGDAAVWWSPDGRRWEQVGVAELAAPGRQVVTSVIAVGDTFLAAGRDEGAGEAAVWASPEGRTWRRLPAEGLGGPSRRSIAGLALGPDGVVAVGMDGDGAVAWTSVDLRSWSATPLGPGVASAVAGLDGAVVAVGAAPGADGGLDAVTWRLAGTIWERSQDGHLAGPADQALLGVALSDVVALAVGHTSFGGGDDAASWSSADAGTWVRTTHDEAVLGGDQAQRMEGVAVLGTTAVAVGWSGSTPEARDAVVWVADQLDVTGAERNL
ncbi:MAG TPA: hypothetical protein VMN58_04525 [Acidimicrobiales bacterium]|nr:hypothetical protein [Acidimicrobiales bacterium]